MWDFSDLHEILGSQPWRISGPLYKRCGTIIIILDFSLSTDTYLTIIRSSQPKMSITQNAILEKKNSLHKAPPPKAPVRKASPPKNNKFQNRNDDPSANVVQLIPSVKLRKTGFRESLIAEDIDNKNIANADEPTNELQGLMARRRAMFEQKEEEEVKPKPKPKPKPPKPASENIKQEEDKENETKLPSNSGSNDFDERKDILTDSNKNVVYRDSRGEPKLCVLPTLERLGKPPPKSPKPEHLSKLLENYDSNRIVMSPKRGTLSRLENNSSLGKLWSCKGKFI